MTLLSVEGLRELNRRLETEVAAELMGDITAYLQASSVNGASAGRLDDERYGLVHEPGLDVTSLEQAIAQTAQERDPEGAGVRVTGSTMDLAESGLSATDNAKALLYTINKFAEAQDDFTICELSTGYGQMLDETRQKMAAVKQTIASNDFDVVFQPIVELATRTVHHHEALARPRGKGHDTTPFGFITFAEDVGLISDFDLAMCRKVLTRIEAARRNGDQLNIAVNLSTRSLESPAFLGELHRLLGAYPSIQHELLFEVTESTKIKDLDAVSKVLAGLRKRGHHVCLDDFGAGAAAFEYLRALHVDYVKIDGVYVRESLTRPNGKAFLRSMSNLCRDLGIQTVGEMVETEAEAALLRDIGIRFGQGYLFGRPRPGISIKQQGSSPRTSTAAI